MAKPTTITGSFERIVWRSKETPEGETPFVIGRIDADGESVGIKGNADPAEFLEGVSYVFQGYMEHNPKYGRTIKFHSWRAKAPHTRRGLTMYLQRHCEGIGAKRASDLFDAFGQRAVEMIRTDPKAVHQALDGAVKLEVLKRNAVKLKDLLKTEGVRIDLTDLLLGRGFASRAIEACLAQWKLNAAQVIRDNPFVLMQFGIPGAGFLRCDKLYLELGHDPAAVTRQAYCLVYALKSDSSGHTWIDWKQAKSQLNSMVSSATVDGKQALATAIEMGLISERKEKDGLWVAERKNATNEMTLAIAIRNLHQHQKTAVQNAQPAGV